MKTKSEPPLVSQIPSVFSVWMVAVLCGLGVFVGAIGLQWLVYDDWMHNRGPLRIVGSAVAFVLTLIFAYRWQLAARRRKLETLRRFETIRWMTDRIRNSLQAIECLIYVNHEHVTDPVRAAVDTIEEVLDEVLLNESAERSMRPIPLTERRLTGRT